MSTSSTWSNVSAPCRLEWRRSRLLAVLLAGLGAFAAAGTVASGFPLPLSVPIGVVALTYGGRLGWLEWRRPALELVIPAGGARPTLDGEPMHALDVQWRGPLATLQWRDAAGHRRYLHGWPDNLGAAARRELRLAMAARVPTRASRSMAP